MFTHIKTSRVNKEIITELTRKWNLGAENVIARMALGYSLEHDGQLDLKDLQDSGGKEYSRKVLLGNYEDIYLGMILSKYQLDKNNSLIQKYVKLHLDFGLFEINKEENFLQKGIYSLF